MRKLSLVEERVEQAACTGLVPGEGCSIEQFNLNSLSGQVIGRRASSRPRTKDRYAHPLSSSFLSIGEKGAEVKKIVSTDLSSSGEKVLKIRMNHKISNNNLIDMLITQMYVINMSKMIQLRNVPDSLHRTLKARAAMEGLSLSDYLIAEISHSSERPTMKELLDRLHKRSPVTPTVSPAQAVREERDSQ